ncbi:MAG: tRNA glutamyl-Q(34) synthetase GluQRS [Verrucomicrobia bacterium]|nr:tRNA glutamyl-Q(34) synthetase GluQRS [Verrucomicrobiota bacterium]
MLNTPTTPTAYRGRIAPSPTGYLHLGHARTFWTAQQRAKEQGGTLVLRMEDLDAARCKPEFVDAIYEDLRWFGFSWEEGPDLSGAFALYTQSQRLPFYRAAFEQLKQHGLVYPCKCSRQDVMRALAAPHVGEEEPVYPGTCRESNSRAADVKEKISWRFRVPDGEAIFFEDGGFGEQKFIAGKDFGDFVIWRHDDVPSYQLSVVVDDAAMQMTEVVRGADLLMSTARQILLYRALELPAPAFYHCQLLNDENGVRLAKRNDCLSLRHLREVGQSPERLKGDWDFY